MTAKLKIDLNQGTLEVEGTETFVKAIYTDFKAQFLGEEVVDVLEKPIRRRRQRKKVVQEQPVTEVALVGEETPLPESVEANVFTAPELVETPEPAVPRPTYNLLKELDFSASGSHPSLVEYTDTKFPITNEERNLVFVYYLQYLLNEKTITPDHIYTCYRAVKIRVPLDLDGSLQTTTNQRHWIKMTKTGRLSVTPAGKLYVENQLPKKIKS